MRALFVLASVGCFACHESPPPFVCATESAPLHTEADFIEVTTSADVRSRYFYVFQPATEGEPSEKPLVLFFNGGPGYTSMLLAIAHTGPTTIDPDVVGEVLRTGPNSASWSRFANLLWVDARGVGFSYDQWTGDGPLPDRDTPDARLLHDPMLDARGFWHVLLGVFAKHPSLACRPVVLAGESYGGARATLMLSMVLDSRDDAGDALNAAMTAHFAQLLPGTTTLPPPEIVARQFGAQILIQPLVAGEAQFQAMSDRSLQRPAPTEPLIGPTNEMIDVGRIVTSPEQFVLLTGTAPQDIALLRPEARTNVVPRGALRQTKLDDVLGVLPVDDGYFVTTGLSFAAFYPRMAERFLANLRWVDTLITDADHDDSIDSGAIPVALQRVSAGFDVALREGDTDRRIEVRYPDGEQRSVRFPRYRRADHTVTLNQPVELLADVVRFLDW